MSTKEKAKEFVGFVDYHKPLLMDGKYTVEVTQTLTDPKIPGDDKFFQGKSIFYVAGEQYVLNPMDIQSVFPPANSTADHSNVLPHIVLNRSTLPWERRNGSGIGNSPWLALLTFNEDEAKQIEEVNSTIAKAGYKAKEEIGQKDDDKLRLLKVRKDVLQKVMPTPEELNYLTHVRQGYVEGNGQDKENIPVLEMPDQSVKHLGNEKAIVISNRLPKKGEVSTAHLVSIENFDFNWETQPELINLVTLKSWTLFCQDHYKITQEALDRLSENDKDLADKLQHLEGNEYFKKNKITEAIQPVLGVPVEDTLLLSFHFGTFTQTLNHLNRTPSTLRLPDKTMDPNNPVNPKAFDAVNSSFQAGLVPVQHHFRKGAKSVSWYRGPLATGKRSETEGGFEFPARASDQLLRYDSEIGMFNVSYAAAWEMGRLLVLSNKRFSTELFQWKRRHTQDIRANEQILIHDSRHLPSNPSGIPSLELPETVQKGFDDLSMLKGVPFNYLVPEEAMLPVESIRFFYIDKLWMDCLLDGAFSIGRVTSTDHEHDEIRKSNLPLDYPTRTGFIMRSDVISGWPDMVNEGYSSDPKQKAPLALHQTRLSENVVLCIFEGEIDRVVMHMKPETIHFGVDVNIVKPEGTTTYNKGLKDPLNGTTIDVPFTKDNNDNKAERVVDIQKIFENIKGKYKDSLNSAQFGYQMVEGVDKVTFYKN